MGNESSGLRFDIYERIHLSEDRVGIGELEEIELMPHIQVITQDNEAVVRGHLLLASAYVGNDEQRSSQTMEHFIPVEITLPINRVRHIDDISVVIDHFDVDLLSARSLNITGVLSLQGIAMDDPANRTPEWEEEITVVHEASMQDEPARQVDVQAETELPQEEPAIDRADPVFEPVQAEWQDDETDDSWIYETADGSDDAEEDEGAEQGISYDDPTAETVYSSTFHSIEESGQPGWAEREPKVAFGKRVEGADAGNALDVGALLQSAEVRSLRERTAQDSEQPNAEQTDARQIESNSTGDELDWKTLFLSSSGEERPFRKVRICIVQKEESLEMIADRYQMNPREILLYNRLADHVLEEGQMIYIPK